jgi:pyridoxamine 5'-phosphate oxidase
MAPIKTTPRAPWRDLFLDHISKMPSPEFVLSTLGPDPTGRFPVIPRARTCIFRGLWASLTPNEKNPVDKNPAAYETDCPTFTTDIRMEKASQIIASASDSVTLNIEQINGSGGGGPVEAVWWVNHDGIMTQWRLRGDAWVLAPDIDDNGKEMVDKTKSEVQKWMRIADEKGTQNWSWDREITAHYGNLAPGMRGM